LAGSLDMRLEAFALGASVRFVVIIVEPALPDRDHARMVRCLDKRCRAEVGMRIGFVRMHADARPHVGLALRDGDNVAPLPLAS
jgi:hypothetical protein